LERRCYGIPIIHKKSNIIPIIYKRRNSYNHFTKTWNSNNLQDLFSIMKYQNKTNNKLANLLKNNNPKTPKKADWETIELLKSSFSKVYKCHQGYS